MKRGSDAESEIGEESRKGERRKGIYCSHSYPAVYGVYMRYTGYMFLDNALLWCSEQRDNESASELTEFTANNYSCFILNAPSFRCD